MKILLLSHCFYPDIGGIEINSEILAYRMAEMENEVHLVTWTLDSNKNKFPFEVIRKPNLHKLLMEHKWADIILENNPCLRLSWPNIFFNKSSVVVLNTWISRINGSRGYQDIIKLFWLKRASKVIAVSKAIKEGTFKDAIVIGNPYRKEKFGVIEEITREKDFVFLGRLVSDKGADLAIKAFGRVLTELENTSQRNTLTCTIIGDGPDMVSLKNLVKHLNIESHVTFTGSLTGDLLMNVLNQHKSLLVPSTWKEPFGNVALEGLACGCIPIVSDGGGLPEAVGQAGLVFSRGSLDSLVQAMLRLIHDPVLVDSLKLNAKMHLKNHTPEVVCEKYYNVLLTAKNGLHDKFREQDFKM
jgi:glycosyltransferase involved in cell wall biosynthesis